MDNILSMGILVIHYLMLESELTVLPCWLPRVACILLTTVCCISHSPVIAARLRDALQSGVRLGLEGTMSTLHQDRRFTI